MKTQKELDMKNFTKRLTGSVFMLLLVIQTFSCAIPVEKGVAEHPETAGNSQNYRFDLPSGVLRLVLNPGGDTVVTFVTHDGKPLVTTVLDKKAHLEAPSIRTKAETVYDGPLASIAVVTLDDGTQQAIVLRKKQK